MVEFNNVIALEAALSAEDVACVLAEPAMTNVGIVHPQPGYHQALRELTRKHGTLLIIDETHTICAGPGATPERRTSIPMCSYSERPLGQGFQERRIDFAGDRRPRGLETGARKL